MRPAARSSGVEDLSAAMNRQNARPLNRRGCSSSKACRKSSAESTPGGVLQEDAIAIRILEGETVREPIWICRWDGREAVRVHSIDGFLPIATFRQVKHEEVFICRCATHFFTAAMREFQVITGSPMPAHHAIESGVVFEPVEHFKAETVAVEAEQRRNVVRCACDAQVSATQDAHALNQRLARSRSPLTNRAIPLS